VEKNHKKPIWSDDITAKVYKNSVNENLLPFAQMSVESSLIFLHKRKILQKTPRGYLLELSKKGSSNILQLNSDIEKIRHRLGNS
jgi:hypothetical protein